jgi:hypothetical protein
MGIVFLVLAALRRGVVIVLQLAATVDLFILFNLFYTREQQESERKKEGREGGRVLWKMYLNAAQSHTHVRFLMFQMLCSAKTNPLLISWWAFECYQRTLPYTVSGMLRRLKSVKGELYSLLTG